MTLNREERAIIVEHRLEKAHETFIEAKDLTSLSHWRGAANRLYYACYYAATALLIQHGHITRTLGGVLGLFSKHFVVPGLFSKEQNKMFQRLFDLRQSGDYSDWVSVERSDVEPFIRSVEDFISQMEKLIDDDAN